MHGNWLSGDTCFGTAAAVEAWPCSAPFAGLALAKAHHLKLHGRFRRAVI